MILTKILTDTTEWFSALVLATMVDIYIVAKYR